MSPRSRTRSTSDPSTPPPPPALPTDPAVEVLRSSAFESSPAASSEAAFREQRERIEQSERRFRIGILSSPVGLSLRAFAGGALLVNEALARMVGRT